MLAQVEALALKVATPFYCYDESKIATHLAKMKAFFEGLDAFPGFAMKANANPHLMKLFLAQGLGMDVISKGEFLSARCAGADPAKIIWNGNIKSLDEMRWMCRQGLGWVNVDSFQELRRWKNLMDEGSDRLPGLFIRVNPEISADTHPSIATGLGVHKFGIGLHELAEVVAFACLHTLPLKGLHVHIGSQISDFKTLEKAYAVVCEEAGKYGLTHVNLGGGWGIPYAEGRELDLLELRRAVGDFLKPFTVFCELGRFLIGEAGWYVVRVREVRKSAGTSLVITDGGMHHLLRPSLYQAEHGFSVFGPESGEKRRIKVMGRLCESGDLLIPETMACLPQEDSLIAIHQAGAYGFSMASHYNGFPLPSEWLLRCNGEWQCIREEEEAGAFLHAVPGGLEC
ncbi:MAG TPA: diaminopimelate decarboxylase [Caldisericia bacterium]|nr:diaminopimelate decarboxylase [Caldisericia bacterium]